MRPRGADRRADSVSDDVRELATKLRLQAERLEGYCRVILGRNEVPEADVMRSIADHLEALEAENEGYRKANELLNKGMESQCELMDGLKQDKRWLEDAIRRHRDQRGDDRCWMDDEELYAALPEGYKPPERDTSVELERCRQYIECRRNPRTVYVSPQRRIDELEAENARLRKQLPVEMQDCTILFRECAKGHGWLTATNWVQHGCPTCERERLRAALRPFAYQALCLVPPDGEPAVDDAEHFRLRGSYAAISAGDCRRAAKALGEGNGDG